MAALETLSRWVGFAVRPCSSLFVFPPAPQFAPLSVRIILFLSDALFCEGKTADTCRVQADGQRLLVAGHSMGGHGAWLFAAMVPDRVLAVLPFAGASLSSFFSVAHFLSRPVLTCRPGVCFFFCFI